MQDSANKTHTEKQNLNVIKYQNEHETYQADKQIPYTELPHPLPLCSPGLASSCLASDIIEMCRS